MSEEKKQIFSNAIDNDPTLREVKQFCSNTCPPDGKNLTPDLKTYVKLKNDIYLSNNLLFLGYKIIVPNQLRKQMLSLVHEAHFGIQKS